MPKHVSIVQDCREYKKLGSSQKQRKTQRALVLAALRRGETVDQDTSFNGHRIYQIASRIHELRKAGYLIRTVREKGWKLARYVLIGEKVAENKGGTGNEQRGTANRI